MVYLNYMFAELRRRRGRTFLTALGLAVGVGLVITVNALSSGLDQAQAQVLKPLTGVGTDMSVTRPISTSSSSGGFRQLSATERAELQKENGTQRFDFRSVAPGTHFTDTSFLSTQLSFSSSQTAKIRELAGVGSAAGGLTLSMTTVSGTAPAQTQTQPRGFGGGGGAPNPGGPRSINFSSVNVSGVDQTQPGLGAVTPGQISKGRFFSSGSKREAILDVGYATKKNLGVGDTVTLKGEKFTVVGISKTPLGGQSADVYVKLTQLQQLSDHVGRVNTVYVRATNANQVSSVSKAITASFPSASVTTAKTLANQVSGSLVDAKNLTSRLGLVLELVGLLGAVLIASLLTLSSVTKRVRELGTLKALGWSKRAVVRQVTGESLLQGVLGGALGIAIGFAGAALVTLFAPSLKATVASATGSALGAGPGPFGQGAVTSSASEAVSLTAHVSIAVIALAVVLAVAGGLISGAVGGLRAARLRPADAFRHLD